MIVKVQYSITPVFEDVVEKKESLGISLDERKYFLHFSVIEGSEQFEHIIDIVESIKKRYGAKVETRYNAYYSDDECAASAFLRVRSIYAGIEPIKYPEYDKTTHFYRTVKYKNKEEQRFEHWIQTGPAKISKAPKWRPTRQFCSDYYSAMTNLYCSDAAKKIIEENGLTGASFRPVLYARKETTVSDLWQFWPEECEDFFVPGIEYTTRVCGICGLTRYVSYSRTGELLIRKDFDRSNLDCMQTPPLFGLSCGYPVYVVSNRAYSVLKRANMTRDLVFTPLNTA